jgi:superfamily I DNA/RNA helicase
MSSPRQEYDEVAFSPSVPVKKEDPNRRQLTTGAIFHGEEDSRKEEAKWVAAEVAELHRERPRETIAVLIPTRTHLPVYVKALMERGVPLRLLEVELLKERPEVGQVR